MSIRSLSAAVLALLPFAAAAKPPPCDLTAERGICLFNGQRSSIPLDVEGVQISGARLDVDAGGVGAACGRVSFSGATVWPVLAARKYSWSGFVELNSMSRLVSPSGSLTIGGGGLVLTDGSRATFGSGDLTVAGGGSIDLSGSLLHVGGGSLNLTDDASTTFVDSDLRVSGGTLGLGGTSSFTSSSSTLSVTGGDVTFRDSSSFRLGDGSSFSLTGGSVSIGDASTLTLEGGSSLRVTGGGLRVVQKGSFVVQNASGGHFGSDGFTGGHVRVGRLGKLELGNASIAILPGGDVRFDAGSSFGGPRASLATPAGAFSAADVAAYDAACAGDVVFAVSEKGAFSVTCRRVAKEGETCARVQAADQKTWECADPCLKGDKGGFVCGVSDHL